MSMSIALNVFRVIALLILRSWAILGFFFTLGMPLGYLELLEKDACAHSLNMVEHNSAEENPNRTRGLIVFAILRLRILAISVITAALG